MKYCGEQVYVVVEVTSVITEVVNNVMKHEEMSWL